MSGQGGTQEGDTLVSISRHCHGVTVLKVMEPVLRKLGPQAFDCCDSKLAWSAKRPVWFQAMVDLLEPYFVPILGQNNSHINSL